MAESPTSVLGSLPSNEPEAEKYKREAEQGRQETAVEDRTFINKQDTFIIGSPDKLRGPYGGYSVTRAADVIVDTGRVVRNKEAREEAFRVARNAQRSGRRASQPG